LSYAPETASPVHLVWVAARKDVSTFTAGAGLDHDAFMRAELGEAAVAGFEAKLSALDLDR
ncbi:IucA/IucC family protein, partial [Streptomyces anulatus]|uniref:IucA/IucC family protein n=1 Tax=Streptomyces anulatus TaxID=1892 RepID=UPI00365AADB2